MDQATIALAIPHAAHLPERAAGLERTLIGLRVRHPDQPGASCFGDHVKLFTAREPNHAWALRMWRWGAESECSHFLTVQDDVLVAPFFWGALHAMIAAKPGRVLGLASVHPAAPEYARQGHRWYRSKGWMPGWAYVVPTALLRAFLPWAEAHLDELRNKTWGGEDFFLARWVVQYAGRIEGEGLILHPVPSIVDHDTSGDSSYGNDENPHKHCTVTWRSHAEADLVSRDWWAVDEGPVAPPLGARLCMLCGARVGGAVTPSGALACLGCAAALGQWALGVATGQPAYPGMTLPAPKGPPGV